MTDYFGSSVSRRHHAENPYFVPNPNCATRADWAEACVDRQSIKVVEPFRRRPTRQRFASPVGKMAGELRIDLSRFRMARRDHTALARRDTVEDNVADLETHDMPIVGNQPIFTEGSISIDLDIGPKTGSYFVFGDACKPAAQFADRLSTDDRRAGRIGVVWKACELVFHEHDPLAEELGQIRLKPWYFPGQMKNLLNSVLRRG